MITTYASTIAENYMTFNREFDDAHADWLVHPCGENRDSDSLTRSNHRVAIKALLTVDPDEKDHVRVEARHFLCGWIATILVRPGSACADLAAEHADAIDGYPALDEDDWNTLETDEATEAFESWAWRDFLEAVCEHFTHETESFRDALLVCMTNEQAKACAWSLLAIAENRCCDGSWKAEDGAGPSFRDLASELTAKNVRRAIRRNTRETQE